MTVAKAVVDLTGAIVKVPTTVKAGKKTPLTFDVTNAADANVAAAGTVQIQLATSPDGLLDDASPLVLLTKHINLKPGKSMRITESVALSATAFVVVGVDPAHTAFPNDSNPDNNVFFTSKAITVA